MTTLVIGVVTSLLIGQLGDRNFRVREEAHRRLAAVNHAFDVRPALREAQRKGCAETANRARVIIASYHDFVEALEVASLPRLARVGHRGHEDSYRESEAVYGEYAAWVWDAETRDWYARYVTRDFLRRLVRDHGWSRDRVFALLRSIPEEIPAPAGAEEGDPN
jgi:hypothetical protein